MQIAYTYDNETLLANGSVAYVHEFDLPDNAIVGAFPATEQFQAVQASSQKDGWIVVADYRGTTVVDAGNRPVVITEIGPLPAGCRVVTENDPDVIAKKLADARAAKLAEIMAGYSAAFAPIEAVYPAAEREGWPLQATEATAVLSDAATSTPVLSAMVALRGQGESVTDLAMKVLANAQTWSMVYAYLTGQQQRMYAEVTALTDVATVSAYPVVYQMPEGM